jgi:hypothetical protein
MPSSVLTPIVYFNFDSDIYVSLTCSWTDVCNRSIKTILSTIVNLQLIKGTRAIFISTGLIIKRSTMRSKIDVVILFVCCSAYAFAQSPKLKASDDLRKAVYSALMDSFCKEKTWAYSMEDSTRNHYIFEWPPPRYTEHFDNSWMAKPTPFPLDAAWIPFLREVDTAISALRKIRIPEFPSIAKVYLLNRDTIRAHGGGGRGFLKGFGWVQAHITLSDIAFSDNLDMAIVEFSEVCGGLCGTGYLIFLQRDKNNKWTVVYKLGLWIS